MYIMQKVDHSNAFVGGIGFIYIDKTSWRSFMDHIWLDKKDYVIFLNSKADLYQVKHLPNDIIRAIKINLIILEENYGTNREFYDEGGVVCVIQSYEDPEMLDEYF